MPFKFSRFRQSPIGKNTLIFRHSQRFKFFRLAGLQPFPILFRKTIIIFFPLFGYHMIRGRSILLSGDLLRLPNNVKTFIGRRQPPNVIATKVPKGLPDFPI